MFTVLSAALGFKLALGSTAIDCGTYSCNALDYTYDGVTYSKTCAGAGWYYKTKTQIEVNGEKMGLSNFCRSEGYDGAGHTAISIPPEYGQNAHFGMGEAVNECNNVISDDYFHGDENMWYWAITFQCVNYAVGAADCCENWSADCYNRRIEGNKFHACQQCGTRAGDECGPCRVACQDPASLDCSTCCQITTMEVDATDPKGVWECDKLGAITKEIAQDICNSKGSKSDCKSALAREVGRCHYDKKSDKCTLRRFAKPDKTAHLYMRCDQLAGRYCKKAVEADRCEYVPEKKTCQDKE